MGRQGGTPGEADYLELGDYNATCSMCGKKRKASHLVRNWQGMYRCPEHNEIRQPQDFVRNILDNQAVPWGQPPTTKFLPFQSDFPATVTPSPVRLTSTVLSILDENSNIILDENGLPITSETAFVGFALAQFPTWTTVVSFAWSWASGGAGIIITDPTGLEAFFLSLASPVSGVAQCVLTNSLGGTATITVPVST